MSPDPSCIVMVIIRTPAVHPAYFPAGVLFRQIFRIHDPFYTVIFRRVEIDLQAVLPVTEKIICASAEDDTVSLIGETVDDFSLGFEDGVPGSFPGIGVNVHLAYKVVEEAVRYIFFVLLHEFRCISSGACSHLYDLIVVEGKSQFFRELFPDVVPAASVLAPDHDDLVRRGSFIICRNRRAI